MLDEEAGPDRERPDREGPDAEVEPQQGRTHPAQPALVARMRPQVAITRAAVGVAVLAVAAAGGAVATAPRFRAGHSGHGWAVVALVCALLILAVCAAQYGYWRRAMADWRGERDEDLPRLRRISWWLHLVSYAVALLALWACTAGSLAVGTASATAALLAFTLLFLVAAQALGAVQYLRESGPSGTIPGHLRRLGQLRR